MKKNLFKKVMSVTVAAATLGAALCAGSIVSAEENGTIMWMSNISSGAQFEAQKALAEDFCEKHGYDFSIVYGDGFNDPQGNLTAVKNGMTSNVVGLIASQDGGIVNIMDEYPDLYVTGYNTNMNAVYSEDPNFASSAAVKEYDHWLGTIADGLADGGAAALKTCEFVKEQGYKKVAIINFPFYAYPDQAAMVAATLEFCAANDIEVVGEPKTLEFQPLEISFFQEAGNDDIDCIIAYCAGTSFVYPAMLQAKMQGLCAARTVMVTGGFDSDEMILADLGENGSIRMLSISPNEDILYSLTLLDKAITGNMYEDFTSQLLDSARYVIDSEEDVNNVMTKSSMTGDASFTQITQEDLDACATYADLVELFHSEKITAEGLK